METTPKPSAASDEAPEDVRRERQLHADVLGHEAELRQALRRLGRETKQTFDIGLIVGQNAPAFLGGAFVIGLWLGSRGSHR